MVFRLIIETENAAFEDAPASEIARILRKLADKLECDGCPDEDDIFRLFDINGNRCGEAFSQ